MKSNFSTISETAEIFKTAVNQTRDEEASLTELEEKLSTAELVAVSSTQVWQEYCDARMSHFEAGR